MSSRNETASFASNTYESWITSELFVFTVVILDTFMLLFRSYVFFKDVLLRCLRKVLCSFSWGRLEFGITYFLDLITVLDTLIFLLRS